jgi:putative MATE family efflux protein
MIKELAAEKKTQRYIPRVRSSDKDWTQGSIFKNLVLLSWPMTVTQTVMSLGPTIDMIWVGKLGAAAVAGVGVSGIVVQLAQSVMMGFTTGMRALISRAIGAGDKQEANYIAQQAVIVTAVFSVLIAVIGHFFGEGIISLVTSDPEVIRLGTIYLRIQFIAGGTIVFRMMMDAIMQASGDAINPMWIAIVYRLFHIALCPFLIFGWWIFPKLGVAGAAYTAIIAQSLGVVLGLFVLLGARSRVKLSFKDFRLDMKVIWRIIRIGFPASIAGVQQNLNQFILQIFIAVFGAAAIAAHTIIMRLNMLLFMPAQSFGMGASVLVGQNLGAKKPERANKSAWLAVWLVNGFAVVLSLAFFIWSGPVIRLFNNDPAMVTLAVPFLHIAIVGWILIGFQSVLMTCLQGAGDTVPPMLIGIATTWLITIPLAYFLPKYTSWGILSIRWAMTASMIVSSIAMVIYFRTGKWKSRTV